LLEFTRYFQDSNKIILMIQQKYFQICIQ